MEIGENRIYDTIHGNTTALVVKIFNDCVLYIAYESPHNVYNILTENLQDFKSAFTKLIDEGEYDYLFEDLNWKKLRPY